MNHLGNSGSKSVLLTYAIKGSPRSAQDNHLWSLLFLLIFAAPLGLCKRFLNSIDEPFEQ